MTKESHLRPHLISLFFKDGRNHLSKIKVKKIKKGSTLSSVVSCTRPPWPPHEPRTPHHLAGLWRSPAWQPSQTVQRRCPKQKAFPQSPPAVQRAARTSLPLREWSQHKGCPERALHTSKACHVTALEGIALAATEAMLWPRYSRFSGPNWRVVGSSSTKRRSTNNV